MSFSLYAVVCKGILEEKQLPARASRAGRDAHLAIHGPPGRSSCAPAELYPPRCAAKANKETLKKKT